MAAKQPPPRFNVQKDITNNTVDSIISDLSKKSLDPTAKRMFEESASFRENDSTKSKTDPSVEKKPLSPHELKKKKFEKERAEQERLTIFVPEEIKRELIAMGKEFDIPYSHIGALAIIQFLSDSNYAKEMIVQNRTNSKIPTNEYAIDFGKVRKKDS